MKKRVLKRVMALIAAPVMAVTGLLLLFLLLGWRTVGPTPGSAGLIPKVLAQDSTFTVSGTVTCEVTGLISDVDVFVWNRDKGTALRGDTTDSDGAYTLTLEEGSYDLVFRPPCGDGCATRAYKGITGPVDVSLNAILSQGHTISGTVYATDGITPTSTVVIYAFNHDTADGFGVALTDASGQYCIGLVEGHYALGFVPPPCVGLGPTAKNIAVTQDTTLDVILPPGFTVGGCVTDGEGNPVPGVQIYAFDPDIGGFGVVPTGESGCYAGTLPLVGTPRTGTYDIQFIPPAGRGLGSVTAVDVVSDTTGCPNTSLPIMLPVGFTVSGRVTCRGEPVKNTFVYADPAGDPTPGDDLVGWGLYTVNDGSYGLPVISDTYDIEFIPPPTAGLNSRVITNIQVVTDTALDIELCHVVYLPTIVKNCADYIAIQGTLRFYALEGGCWVVEAFPSVYELVGALAGEIKRPANDSRSIVVWGQFYPGFTLCMMGIPFEVLSYEFLE